jgi:hypothetical protein
MTSCTSGDVVFIVFHDAEREMAATEAENFRLRTGSGGQLLTRFLYIGKFCVSVQYCSHACSKLPVVAVVAVWAALRFRAFEGLHFGGYNR